MKTIEDLYITAIPLRDPVSDSGPILKHRSGPSSQLSGPIVGFLECVEDAQRLRLPSAPFHRRGPTGLHRTQIAKMKKPNRKNASAGRRKLFTNSKFRMILVALIPVANYNAQVAVKRGANNDDLWLCPCQHQRTRSWLAGSRVDGCRLCKSVQGESLGCKD